MQEKNVISWENALDMLIQWKKNNDKKIERELFSFIDIELQLMIPAQVRRAWSPDDIKDTLQDFVIKLIDKPLTGDIKDLRSFLHRSLRNFCIDSHRARGRKKEASLYTLSNAALSDAALSEVCEQAAPSTPLDTMTHQEDQTRYLTALHQLSIADRVALKLTLAPEWLTAEEVEWLAQRGQTTASEVRASIQKADTDIYQISKIFDPGDDDPDDLDERRLRMERFRRRRSRALERLRGLLKEDEGK